MELSCHIPILILNFRISSWLEWSFPAIFILYLLEFLPGWDGLKTGAELTCHISLSFSIFVLVSITLERYQVLYTVQCTVQSLGITFMKFCTIGKGVIKILLSNFFYTWPGFFWQYCNDYLLHEKAAKLNNWAGRNREHYHYTLYMSSDLLYTNIQNSFYPIWWTIFRLYSRKLSKDGILNHHIKTTL